MCARASTRSSSCPIAKRARTTICWCGVRGTSNFRSHITTLPQEKGARCCDDDAEWGAGLRRGGVAVVLFQCLQLSKRLRTTRAERGWWWYYNSSTRAAARSTMSACRPGTYMCIRDMDKLPKFSPSYRIYIHVYSRHG